MQIANFTKPYEKIKCINKLKLPLEICGIIKEFIFYDKNSLHFIKKLTTEKKELGTINRAWSRKNPAPWLFNASGNLYTEKSSNWAFAVFADEFVRSKRDIFLSENCPKCGEFKYISYKFKPHVHTNYNLCLC